jgi:hypothetical protein
MSAADCSAPCKSSAIGGIMVCRVLVQTVERLGIVR